jgi:hypothetical protein
MVYQMGQGNFSKFQRLINAVKAKDWGTAVNSMENSKWSRSDSPLRARRMAVAMRNNTFPPAAIRSPPGQRFAVPGLKNAVGAVDASPVGSSSAMPGPRKPWPFDNE